jgi:DNA-binding MarR family transcriptional regulator
MKWLERHQEIVKLHIKISNQYVNLYAKGIDYGSGILLSFSEMQVVELIMDNEDFKMIDLANELGFSGPAISKSVKKLVEKNVIEKYKMPYNNKEFRMRVTEVGINAYKLYQSYVYDNIFGKLFETFEEKGEAFEEDLVEVYKYMEKFNEEMKLK